MTTFVWMIPYRFRQLMHCSNIPHPPPLPLSPPIYKAAWIPEGAIFKTPSIFHLPDRNQILKAGQRVHMVEAEAMRFVASRTSIPVLHVHEAYETAGTGYYEKCGIG